MSGEGRCGQATDVDAAVWQALTAATVTPGTAAVGVRIDNAAPQGGLSGRWRRAPPPGAPLRRRGSGVAQRVIRLFQRRAGRRLRWGLAHGRCWVRVGVRPEPVPTRGDSITMHIYDPSQCLKSP